MLLLFCVTSATFATFPILQKGSVNDVLFLNQNRQRRQSVNAIDPTYQVRILYIIPSDRIPRQGHERTILEIAQYVRDFYETRTGMTFSYDRNYPLFEVIRSPLTEADIINGTFLNARLDDDGGGGNIKNTIQNLIEMVYATPELKFQREQLKTLFFGISEITPWAALGGGGFGHVGGSELDLYEMFRNQNITIPFEHELGHAFGLSHINETIACLQGFFPEIQYEYTFMVPIYTMLMPEGQPMANWEKTLLTDPRYEAVECLELLQGRPHPSNYLVNKGCQNIPDINFDGVVNIDDLAICLVRWGSCPVPVLELNCRADLNCDRQVNIADLAKLLVNWSLRQSN